MIEIIDSYISQIEMKLKKFRNVIENPPNKTKFPKLLISGFFSNLEEYLEFGKSEIKKDEFKLQTLNELKTEIIEG